MNPIINQRQDEEDEAAEYELMRDKYIFDADSDFYWCALDSIALAIERNPKITNQLSELVQNKIGMAVFISTLIDEVKTIFDDSFDKSPNQFRDDEP